MKTELRDVAKWHGRGQARSRIPFPMINILLVKRVPTLHVQQPTNTYREEQLEQLVSLPHLQPGLIEGLRVP